MGNQIITFCAQSYNLISHMEKNRSLVLVDEDENIHWVVIAKLRYVEGNAFIVTVFMGKLTYFLDDLRVDFGS